MQPTSPKPGAVTFHVPAGRTLPGVNANLKATAVPPLPHAALPRQVALPAATQALGDPALAAAPGSRTLSQRVAQAFNRAPLFFKAALGGLAATRPVAGDDNKAGPASGDDDPASDVRTEASGLSRAGRHPSMSQTLMDASTSLGYQMADLPEAHELGVLDEVLGAPRAPIIKGYASQPWQFPTPGDRDEELPGQKEGLAALNPGDAVSVGRYEVVFRRFTWLDGVKHMTVDTARPDKPDGNDVLRYQALCLEVNAVPAGDGLVHLALPASSGSKGGRS